MNPVPFLLRFVLGWPTIKAKVALWAKENGHPTPEDAPDKYRWEGWGTVGFPPRLACNVKYFPPPNPEPRMEEGRMVSPAVLPMDLGRFVG